MTPDEERLAKAFGLALNQVRLRHNLSILELSQRVSGRTYLSDLERGLKLPTLGKIDSIARALNVHPVSLIALAYEGYDQLASQSLLAMVEDDHKYLKLWTSGTGSPLTDTNSDAPDENTD